SPKLRPSQGVPVSDELFFSRKRASRNLFQNSIDFNSEHSSVCAGAMGSHQPQISGKCGTLGYTQARGKSGSVDSDLQFLGLNNSQQDRVCASLNFPSKTQRSFCSQAEHTVSFQGPTASQGAFILPSYPLSSPRNSPKHVSAPADSPKKSQDNTMNFSNSWPLKSFEGLPKPSSQKRLLGQKSGDGTGRKVVNIMKTDFRFAFCVASSSGEETHSGREAGSLVSPNPFLSSFTRARIHVYKRMQNSLRSLRNSAAKKRAKLSGNISDLESPDSALKLDLSVGSPSHASSPSVGSCSESGVYSQESLTSPVSAVPQRRRIAAGGSAAAVGADRGMSVCQRVSQLGWFSSPLPSATHFLVGKRALVNRHNTMRLSGVFGSPPPARVSGQSVPCAVAGEDQAGTEGTEPTAGLCGRGVRQDSASHFHLENEKEIKVAMSKSAQDKMRRKKREEKDHQEVKDLEEKEEYPWERLKLNEPEKITTENEMSLGARGRYKDRTPSVTHSPEIMDPSELQPFSKPETALTEALALLADDDWEKKIEGLNFVRCLSAYHATVLTAKLHETSLAVAQEVKNLRSGVSRAAVVCLGDLFTYLKKSMDQELDNTVKVLLHKAGESNTFIREEVDKALKAMVNNVTPARALCSLINGGQRMKRVSGYAAFLHFSVLELHTYNYRQSYKASLCLRCMCHDPLSCRYYGRKMLFSMMTHPDFDKTLEKYVPTKDLPYIKESVSNLREKGLGEMPLDTPSAKGRRSHTGSVGHSRSSSTSRDALNITDR
ncbi:TGRM1 protein, partial [Pluvianellus socialis]|nr:TGRM1 protein [Pluvianellus socialis]